VKRKSKWWLLGFIVIIPVLAWMIWNIGLNVYSLDEPITSSPSDCQGDIRFAIIGDYGDAGEPEADVSELVDEWGVDFIVTTGDNNYPDGEASTIDANIGQYYANYIFPYQGEYKSGTLENRFFPALGNHDWGLGHIGPYLDYFTLPGNERYYELEQGPVRIFILDSDPREPDGRHRDSVQAGWLEDQLEVSDTVWNLVILHHPPYSSSLERGLDHEMQWPYGRWGADAVISGHDHLYERLHREGILYFVNGLAGKWTGLNPIHRFLFPIEGSKVRYNQDYGAMIVTADSACINFSFINRNGKLIDSHTLKNNSEL
jgi:hypothetical protein